MATTYDKASLVMIPSGYKDDKLYSIKPTDGSGDFTFSRDGAGASPATRVNASGLIEKGRENVLLQSNQFDTTWVNSNTTETGGQSGYDGSSNAWLLSKSAASGYIYQSVSNSGVATFSCYAKAGTTDWFRIRINTAGTTQSCFYDLTNGVIGTNTSIESKIESIGGGWYRCTLAFNQTTTEVRLYPAEGDLDLTGTSGSIYIQDAQLESGLISTSYIETTTAPVSAGLLGDMPRLDYSGGATCPSLLLEPSRVNVLPHSEYYNASQWTKTRCTISDNTDETLSPEGVYNASKMVSTDASESYVQDEGTISGTKANLSFFAKKGDTNFVHGLVWDNSANGCRQWFNVNTGAVGGTTTFGSGYSVVSGSEKIEDFGNGWYRCSFTANVTTGVNAFRANLSSADTTITSPVNAYGYFYGVQAESGSYPTSYIPTYGSASTRGVDNCSKTGVSSLLNGSQGVLFVEISPLSNDGTTRHIGISDNTAANRLQIFWNSTSQTQVRVLNLVDSTKYFDMNANVTLVDGYAKVALKYKENDFSLWVNGEERATDNSGLVWEDNVLDTIKFADGGGTNPYSGKTKQVLYFPTALTDAELAALTTI